MKYKILVALLLCPIFSFAQDLSILQGATSYDSVQVNVLVPHHENYTYSLTKGTTTIAPASVLRYQMPGSEWATETIFFKYLKENDSYVFDVNNSAGKIVDSRNLRTLPSKKKNFRFAFASCMNHKKREQTAMWDTVLSEKPDILFLVGDNNYSAHNIPLTPLQMWEGYVTSRRALHLYKLKTLIPSLATWDDHDFGVDNGNSHYAFVKENQATFEAFYGQTDQVSWITRGPGVSRVVELMGQRFFLLDGRSFQTDLTDTFETFFGTAQEAWFERELLKSDQPAWIINGTVLFGKNQLGETIERTHKQSYKRFVSTLKTSRAPMVFVSGDIHYSMVQDVRSLLGFRAYELTSSSIHSTPNPVAFLPNDRRLAVTNSLNFLLANVTPFDLGFKFDVESVNAKNKRAFALTNLVVTVH